MSCRCIAWASYKDLGQCRRLVPKMISEIMDEEKRGDDEVVSIFAKWWIWVIVVVVEEKSRTVSEASGTQ